MSDVLQPAPPSAYANPYAGATDLIDLICEGARGVAAVFRRRREVRLLERIGVLPPGWDAAGRHGTLR